MSANIKIDHSHDFSKKLFDAENYLVNNFYLVNPMMWGLFPKYDGNINRKINKKSII